jgi:hypothetical protein
MRYMSVLHKLFSLQAIAHFLRPSACAGKEAELQRQS